MKRTALKRPTKPITRNTPVRKRRPGKRRVAVLRDEKYKAYVRTKPCCVCLRIGVESQFYRAEAAHTEPTNGMASKGPDSGCAPLCLLHRRGLHRAGLLDFNKRYMINLRAIAANTYIEYLAMKVKL